MAFPAQQQVGGSPSDLRRRMAAQLLMQAGSTEPVEHWSQGAARLAQGLVGGLQMQQLAGERREGNALLADFIARRMGALTPGAPAGGVPAPGGAAPAGAAPTAPAATPGAAPGYSMPSATWTGEEGAPADAPMPRQAPIVATGDSPLIPPNLMRNESGGNFAAQNNAMGAGGQRGHFGRLQFGQARLLDAQRAGVIPAGTTPQQFMADPEMQRRVEAWHFEDIDRQIAQRGLDRAIGTQIGGTTVTPEGMRAAAHLGGVGGLARFIQSGGQYDPADVNGTRLSAYLAQSAGTPAPGVAAADRIAAPSAGMVAPSPQAVAPPVRPMMAGIQDREMLVRLLNNEYTAPVVSQMIAAEMAPAGLQLVQRPDGTFAFNPRTGQMVQVGPRPPRDPMVVPNSGRLVDPTTGRVLVQGEADPVVVPPGASLVDRQALRGQAAPGTSPPVSGGPAPSGGQQRPPGVLYQGRGFRSITDPEERRRLGISETDRRVYQEGPDGRVQAVQDTPNTQVTTSVNTATNPLVEGYSRQFTEQRERASAAADTIRTLHQARAQLDEPGGIISGAFAQGRLDLARVGTLFGITDERSVANTEAFRAAIGQSVLSSIRALGTNPSNTDREYIERVAAGNVALNETSIRRVIDIQERYARQAIERYNQTFGQVDEELRRVPGADQSGLAIMRALGRVGMPGEYVRAGTPAPGTPPGQQPPGQPAPQAAPQQQSPANLPRPTSRQEMEALPPGTQFVAPDGSVRVRP